MKLNILSTVALSLMLASPAWAEPSTTTTVTIIDSEFTGKSPENKFIIKPYSVTVHNTFHNYQIIVNTEEKSLIRANRFDKKCWFTIDGKDYKTPKEIEGKLKDNMNVIFLENKFE